MYHSQGVPKWIIVLVFDVIFSLTNIFCWRTADNRKGGNILCYDAAGQDDGSFADCNTRLDLAVGEDNDIGSNFHRLNHKIIKSAIYVMASGVNLAAM